MAAVRQFEYRSAAVFVDGLGDDAAVGEMANGAPRRPRRMLGGRLEE